MLDFHSEFRKFDEKIQLSESKKEKMRISRDAIENTIVDYHKDILKVREPSFKAQGSFVINTALNPIANEEVDMDYGIYLNDQPDDMDEWITPRKAHERILEALKGHTQDESVSKTNCVRVLYRNFYHLDLPIYIIFNEKAYLAQTKQNSWIHSDAREFQDWYYSNRNDEMLSRIVRYVKAWRDNTKSKLKSLEITIATVIYANLERKRDDLVLYDTVTNIVNELSIRRSIYKPVAPFEDLWDGYSESDIDEILKELRLFRDDLHIALNSSTNKKGSVILREIFGDRFPIKEDEGSLPEPQRLTSGAKPWKM